MWASQQAVLIFFSFFLEIRCCQKAKSWGVWKKAPLMSDEKWAGGAVQSDSGLLAVWSLPIAPPTGHGVRVCASVTACECACAWQLKCLGGSLVSVYKTLLSLCNTTCTHDTFRCSMIYSAECEEELRGYYVMDLAGPGVVKLQPRGCMRPVKLLKSDLPNIKGII